MITLLTTQSIDPAPPVRCPPGPLWDESFCMGSLSPGNVGPPETIDVSSPMKFVHSIYLSFIFAIMAFYVINMTAV